MRPRRIGIEGSLAVSKRPTGVEHFAQGVLNELLRISSKDVEWFVYLPPYADLGSSIPEGVHARYRPDANTLLKTPWLVSSVWRDRLDVIFSFSHRLPRACPGSAVLSVYDTAFDQFPECYPPGAAARAQHEVRHACRRARRLVVPSAATRECLVRDYGVPGERIDVILAASRSVFCGGTNEALPGLVPEDGIPYFLCVGRLDRRKNLLRVIQAYRRLVAEGVRPCRLVIAGPDDSGSAEVREQAAAGKVDGEQILFTGYVSDEQLSGLYRRACALVFPSLAEGFGLPVLESMACGTPVITSKVSSMPEVAGDAAMLVAPTDVPALAAAMQRILNDPVEVSRMRSAGLHRAAEFSWRATAERLAESLLRAGGAGT